MKLIAVTGGIGAGKSAVSKEFEKLGAYVLDADKVSHEIMMQGGSAYNEVVKEFGEEILFPDKNINRKMLGDIVFADDDRLNKLNEIMHSRIYAEIEEGIEKSKAPIVCLEIPLLFTTQCPLKLNMKIAVIAPRDIKIARVMERDGISREQVIARMGKQLTDEEFSTLADVIIQNDGDEEYLALQVADVYNRLLKM